MKSSDYQKVLEEHLVPYMRASDTHLTFHRMLVKLPNCTSRMLFQRHRVAFMFIRLVPDSKYLYGPGKETFKSKEQLRKAALTVWDKILEE